MSARLFGLIGYPLSHSFSQKYFTEKFRKENISDCEYQLFPLKNISEFPRVVMDHHNLRGLNVTTPYKESVIPFLNELDETARNVGAVNCIRVDFDPKKNRSHLLTGYNTDVFGFAQSIKPFLEQKHERAMVLGTGGAAKAVTSVLKQIGVEVLQVSRSRSKGHTRYTELTREAIAAHLLIVNATPAGMFPNINEAPPIPYEFLGPSHFLYDLVYNPEETVFLKKGKEKGALTMNGLSMLHLQAEKAWEIWNRP